MIEFSLIQKILLWAIPVIFGITVHEVSHGWVASKLGDKTALMLGRLTLNPIKHIDPLGTIIIPAILLSLGGFVFGWAKPVPVTWRNLRHPKRDMVLVAIAGPLSNFLMAFLWAVVMKIGVTLTQTLPNVGIPLAYMGRAGILINAVLMVLNLLPLPPLDGGRVVSGLLPGRLAYYYDQIEPYGFIIIVILLATKLLGVMLSPFITGFISLIAHIFNI